MPLRKRHRLFISVVLIGLFFSSVLTTYAETVNYSYDRLNRLKSVRYGNGTIILYTYDGVGNRSEQRAINANPQLISQVITSYYTNILGRTPEPGGVEAWTAEIQRIASLGIDIAEGFIAAGKFFFNSDEYLAMGKSDSAYVTDLYEAFLNRTPSQGEVDYWVSYLGQGMSRNEVLVFFVFSEEFRNYVGQVFGVMTARPENNLINDFYRGIVSRLPDDEGFNYWLGWMREGQCVGTQEVINLSYQIASLFVSSAEYAARNRTNSEYVEDLYDAIMRRSATPSEINYWVSYLDTSTREQVLQYFAGSTEFQGRVQAVINAGCLQ
jgi:YD repeat-containing protein